MRWFHAHCLAIVLSCIAATATAQDEAPKACKAYVSNQWSTLGTGSVASCLRGLDEAAGSYNAQGFKFGLWGTTLLSADRYYFYSSQDGGKNWQALGLKADLAQATEVAPRLGGESRAAAVINAVEQDASVAAPPPAAATTTAAAPAQRAPAPAREDRRSCSVRVNDDWKVRPGLTLLECATELDRSPDSYDENGFKYAYWAGMFLAADRKEVMQSADSRRWESVMDRVPR